MSRTVLVLNGPNLDLLGSRETEIYGTDTLDDVLMRLRGHGEALGVAIDAVQSNHEGVLVDAVRDAGSGGVVGALVNAAAYTHTSIALRDALVAAPFPFVEVHISNVWSREPFRHHSMLADRAIGVVGGLGAIGYELALTGLLAHLDGRSPSGEV